MLTKEGEFNGETTTTFYDTKSRAIAVNKTNYLGGTTSTRSNISFGGLVLDTNTSHKRTANSKPTTVKEQFTYTPQSRLENHFHQVNGFSVELLAHNQYDELGHLISKQVGGQDTHNFDGLQQVDYTYNIRGWLTNINNVEKLDINNDKPDLFAFKINYNHLADDLGGTIKSLYNGNIAETFWRSATDNVLRKYSYQYDNLNRLNNAIYQKPDFPVAVTNSYNESMDYDKNGNIAWLSRTGSLDDQWMPLVIDELGYNYSFNRLLGVKDGTNNPNGFRDMNPYSNDYDYDDFGNMTHDANKGIENIKYNHLNLPVNIILPEFGEINYIYNALGQKVMKTVKDFSTDKTTTTDYLDGFQYMNGVLQFFPTAEGYVNYTEGKELKTNYSYVYQYKDHLGNIRLSYTQDPEGNGLKVLEENHYYPYGLKHTNYNTDKRTFENGTPMLSFGGDTSAPTSAELEEKISLTAAVAATTGKAVKVKPETVALKLEYKYKYNGKELQEELGLNMYDYGARNYDPTLGRWINIDPLAEANTNKNPYNFCSNNPITRTDPTGMLDDDIYVNNKTQQVSVIKTNDKYDRVIVDGKNTGNTEKGEYKIILRNQNKYHSNNDDY